MTDQIYGLCTPPGRGESCRPGTAHITSLRRPARSRHEKAVRAREGGVCEHGADCKFVRTDTKLVRTPPLTVTLASMWINASSTCPHQHPKL